MKTAIAWTVGAVGLMGACYLALSVLPGRQHRPASAARPSLDVTVARAKEVGIPWERKDLRRNPPVPPEQNMAPLLRVAIEKVDPRLEQRVDEAFANRRDAALRRRALSEGREALALFEPALERPRLDFDRDWDLGPELPLKESRPIMKLSQLLMLKGLEACAVRDVAAVRTVAAQLGRLSKAVAEEPTLVSLLLAVGIEMTRQQLIEAAINAFAREPEIFAEMRQWLQPPLPSDAFANALRGEVYMGIAAARNLNRYGGIDGLARLLNSEAEGPNRTGMPLVRSGVPADPEEQALLARHLELWTLIFRDLRSGESALNAASKADEGLKRAEENSHPSFRLTTLVTPYLTNSANALLTLEARRRSLIGLTYVLAADPSTEPAIPPDLRDPFDGKRLRLKVESGTVRVYSVGADRVDNGGMSRKERPGEASGFDEVVMATVDVPTPRMQRNAPRSASPQ